MPVLINFKICDNAPECSGISVCPTQAIYYDDDKQSIAIDEEKCILCGACEQACPVLAIKVAQTMEDFNRLKKEIDDDPRTIKDLLVERYGSILMQSEFLSYKEHFENMVMRSKTRPYVAEFNTDKTIECLIKSIPISEILHNYNDNTMYVKYIIEPEDFKKFGITKTPCLLFYSEGKLVGMIKGYYTAEQKQELFKLIPKI